MASSVAREAVVGRMLAAARVRIREYRWLVREPALLAVLLAVTALLLIFVVLPVLRVLTVPSADHWLQYFQREAFVKATRNSLFMAVVSTTSAMLVGFLYAYALVRADIPAKPLFRTVALLPLVSPPFVTGLATILLFGRRGLITHGLLGLTSNPYGWHGLWFAQTLAFFPIAYLSIAGILRAISPSLELAAHNLGARRWAVFRTITVPLAAPGIASAALLVSILVLADFGNPMLLGGDFHVLATEAYMQVIGRYNTEMAAVLCTVLLLPAMGFFLAQRYWLEKRVYTTVTGRPTGLVSRRVSPPVRWAIFGGCLAVAGIVTSVYLVIAAGAFVRIWGVDWSLTLGNFQYTLFRQRDLYNSVRFGLTAAFFTAVLATTAAYLTQRKSFPGRGVLDFLTLLPVALPGTLVGIGFVLAFNQAPIELTGTAAIIVIAMAVRTLPIGYRLAAASLHQIETSIEWASRNLGASSLTTFRRVILPLLKYAFAGSLVYTFVKSVNTLSAVVFLITPGKIVASASILGLADHGYWGQATALAFSLIVVALLSLAVLRLIAGRRVQLFDL